MQRLGGDYGLIHHFITHIWVGTSSDGGCDTGGQYLLSVNVVLCQRHRKFLSCVDWRTARLLHHRIVSSGKI